MSTRFVGLEIKPIENNKIATCLFDKRPEIPLGVAVILWLRTTGANNVHHNHSLAIKGLVSNPCSSCQYAILQHCTGIPPVLSSASLCWGEPNSSPCRSPCWSSPLHTSILTAKQLHSNARLDGATQCLAVARSSAATARSDAGTLTARRPYRSVGRRTAYSAWTWVLWFGSLSRLAGCTSVAGASRREPTRRARSWPRWTALAPVTVGNYSGGVSYRGRTLRGQCKYVRPLIIVASGISGGARIVGGFVLTDFRTT